MRRLLFSFFLMLLPVVVSAKSDLPGVGILCPRTDAQVTFYTQNNQQDAAGTIAFQAGSGFTVTSDTVKSLESDGVQLIAHLCAGDNSGIRIESKRDGWLQAGKLWMPPNQEWDYADWEEYLRKTPIWKPVAPFTLYQGSTELAYKDKPYAYDGGQQKTEIYPLKFTDDFALVLIDKTGAFAKGCAADPVPPAGPLGWVHIGNPGEGVATEFVPDHTEGCPAQ